MKNDDLETRMRRLEWFHALRVPDGLYPVIRVDGRSFSRFTEPPKFEKPFDPKFHAMMVETTKALVDNFQALYGYVESDEISILLPKEEDLFDRELEKFVSISAGIASAAFTAQAKEAAHFDSRVWIGPTEAEAVDYFRWRQSDAARCAINSWCYWTMRKEGMSASAATKELLNKGTDFKNEFLFNRGINFAELPAWQRRGTGVYWEEYNKIGFNPIEQKEVLAKRRRLKIDEDLPAGTAYDDFINKRIRENRFLSEDL